MRRTDLPFRQTWKQPMLYTTVFHTDPRLYTLLMVDLGERYMTSHFVIAHTTSRFT